MIKAYFLQNISVRSTRVLVIGIAVCLLMLVRLRTPGPAAPHTDAAGGPHQRCRDLFTIDKGSHDAIWNTDTHYEELSRQLPSLLAESDVGNSTQGGNTLSFYSGTRLQLLNGSVPFIPCQVRQYEAREVRACSATRKARGTSTWVALVGDSTQRQKLHSFLSFLPTELTYTYFIGDREVTLEDLTFALSNHEHRPPTYDILGRRPPKTTTTTSRTTTTPKTTTSRTPTTPKTTTITSRTTTTTTSPPTLSRPLKTGDNRHTVINSHKPSPRGGKLVSGESKPDNHNVQTIYIRSRGQGGESSHEESFIKISENMKLNYSERLNKTLIKYSNKSLLESDKRLTSYDLRLTLVWAPSGSVMDHPFSSNGRKVTKLHDLATAMVVPDVVVVGLGTWFLLAREFADELVPFTKLDQLLQPVLHYLALLAARTTVLVWSQSRYRWFNHGFEDLKNTVDLMGQWRDILYHTQFNDSTPFLDSWLWRILRLTEAWQWDSSLPFNLANVRECKRVNDAGLRKYPFYKGLLLNVLYNPLTFVLAKQEC